MSILLSLASIVVGGMLGNAINASYDGRLSQFITGPESPAIEMYSPDHYRSSGWYGEHAGKWLYAAANAYERTGDEAMLNRVKTVADFIISFREDNGYIGCYKPEKRFYVQKKDHYTMTWDLWNTDYIMKGLCKVYTVTGDKKYLDAANGLAELMYNTFIVNEIPIANTGEHSGMASLGGLDALCDLYVLSPSAHLKELIYRNIDELDSTPGLGLLKKGSLGLDVEYIGNGKIYEMIRCLTGLAKAYEIFGEKYWLQAVSGCWENIYQYHLTPLGGPWGGVGLVKEFFNRENCFSPYQVSETCEVMQWMELCKEMLNITHDGRYADEIEKSSYNALLAAMGEDGIRWIYYLRTNGDYETGNEWSCCWSSGMTAMEDVPDYMYTTSGSTIYANILSKSTFSTKIGGKEVKLSQNAEYTTSCGVQFKAETDGAYTLSVHVPAWSEFVKCTLNGKSISCTQKNNYVSLKRKWKAGDTFDVAFADGAKTRIIEKVRDYKDSFGWPSNFLGTITHHVCFAAGPLVYASEFDDCYWNDNNGTQHTTGAKMVVKRSDLSQTSRLNVEDNGFSQPASRDDFFTLNGVTFHPICQMPPYKTTSKRSIWVQVVDD